MKDFKSRYPHIELAELFSHFPRMTVPDDPALSEYSWEDCHRGFIGAGGLFLVSEMARKLELEPGMRVLDLCCGNSSSSIFLARHYGVKVIALDRDADPTENWKRTRAAGLTDAITPMKMDARNILLPEDYFDAVFCLNSYFYFGTDDLYLPYITRFIRAGGRIGIASPCYAKELTSEIGEEFLYDAPLFTESLSVHSPKWWRHHFEASRAVRVLECEKHSQGRNFWLDQIRWFVEECHPRDMEPWMREMVYRDMVMLLSDSNEFVTYLTLLAVKPGASR